MKIYFGFIFLIFLSLPCFSQLPKSGVYIYTFCEDEFGKCLNNCKVVINGNRITIYALDGLSVEKGAIIDKGILMKHKTGVWIIGNKKTDINLNEIGGCSDGPSIINFTKKEYRTC